MPPEQRVGAPPGAGRARARSLVVLRAGDASLHPQWIAAAERDFDLFISYYGNTPGRWREHADGYEERRGPKWPALADLLRERPELLNDYATFWFPDDDLAASAPTIDRMFAFFKAYQLALAQPALTRDSYFTWNTLLQDPSCHLRFGGFVEVMAPIFSREALRVCLPTFGQSTSGWGLDWVWPVLLRRAGLERLAIIDATPVRHTRPPGGELYRNHPQMDPRRDAETLLRSYGLLEVRAVAKYSFGHRVRETPLPLHQRLLFGLKRLNGRRKHARAG